MFFLSVSANNKAFLTILAQWSWVTTRKKIHTQEGTLSGPSHAELYC